jgi:hypothetical protein
MNNLHIRKYIFSYLRKVPQIRCYYCNKVLMWDNVLEPILSYFKNNIMIDLCNDCYTIVLRKKMI